MNMPSRIWLRYQKVLRQDNMFCLSDGIRWERLKFGAVVLTLILYKMSLEPSWFVCFPFTQRNQEKEICFLNGTFFHSQFILSNSPPGNTFLSRGRINYRAKVGNSFYFYKHYIICHIIINFRRCDEMLFSFMNLVIVAY